MAVAHYGLRVCMGVCARVVKKCRLHRAKLSLGVIVSVKDCCLSMCSLRLAGNQIWVHNGPPERNPNYNVGPRQKLI